MISNYHFFTGMLWLLLLPAWRYFVVVFGTSSGTYIHSNPAMCATYFSSTIINARQVYISMIRKHCLNCTGWRMSTSTTWRIIEHSSLYLCHSTMKKTRLCNIMSKNFDEFMSRLILPKSKIKNSSKFYTKDTSI